MNLALLDYLIITALVLMLGGLLLYSQRYVRNTADFLAANRSAGRYLLAIASGISGVGAITIISNFEMNYTAGFSPVWWGFITGFIGLLSSISGFVTYRFRETRALTLAQFLEMRYSRKFRILAGLLAWGSGVANYGIFPAVTVRFFMYFCGIPQSFGFMETTVPTYPFLVFLGLSLGVVFAIFGGQVTIMITDFFQGMMCNVIFLVMLLFLFSYFSWDSITSTLVTLSTESKSLVDPFKSNNIRDFNPWFFIINTIAAFYSIGCWLGSQGYQAAAKSPHESKMAAILGSWRGMTQNALFLLIPICALVVMRNMDFSVTATAVQNTLDSVNNPQLREQIVVPMVLLNILPVGMIGLFAAVMFAAMLSTDNTYMHSWGSILVQDVIMPLRGKPFSPKAHMLMLRLSIILVAIIAFAISNLYKQTQYIMLYCNITGAIFMGGAGSVVIGGLYWKKGSTLGAYLALSSGAILAVGNIVLCQWLPAWYQNADGRPLLNEQWGFGISIAGAITLYILGSLYSKYLRKESDFNLDRMLHRNAYAEPGNTAKPETGLRALGFTNEFSRGDRFIFYAGLVWTVLWFVVGALLGILELTGVMSTELWADFWMCYVIFGTVVGFLTTIWFLIGGTRDIRNLFRDLRNAKNDQTDDGWVGQELEK